MTERACIEAALARLFLRTTHGIRPRLDRTVALLDALGHPERSFLVVHVAGTNGKGSVCAMIEAVLRAAGLVTGLYTSPHLVRFNERIRVNGVPVRDDELAELLVRAEAAAAPHDGGPGGPATFFELTTAMAFEYFRARGVQAAVVETGMGGRWDATNVVLPAVSVLCEIDIDHAEYLGRSIAEIAAEKAGIIKRGRPVVCGVTQPEAREVVVRTARDLGAPLRHVAEAVRVSRLTQDLNGQKIRIETGGETLRPLVLPLLGAHQLGNCAIAVAALETFAEVTGLPLFPDAARRGLQTVSWPARLQVLDRDPPVLLDGAHNPHGARALAGALGELAGGRRIGLIAGLLSDKDAAGFTAALAPVACRVWTTPVASERARPAEELAAAFRAAGTEAVAQPSLEAAWDAARAWARAEGGWVVIAGSLYLAGEVLKAKAGGGRLFEESDTRCC